MAWPSPLLPVSHRMGLTYGRDDNGSAGQTVLNDIHKHVVAASDVSRLRKGRSVDSKAYVDIGAR